jgi:F-type H+-transporting ATPase subunit alpha
VFDNQLFQQLVDASQPTGEVVGVDRFLVRVKGLDGVSANALVVFQSGGRGMVREVSETIVFIMSLESESIQLGDLVVLQDNVLTTGVGEGLIGRVVNPLGQPLDGKGAIAFESTWPVYNEAPGIMERSILKDQLPSGVTMVDMLFPVVLGQRIAVLGDTKSGKSAFLMQLGITQTNTDRIVVYVLIGKRRVEIDRVVNLLNETGAIKNSIVVVANMFDSLAQSYLAPYIGCAIGEFLWQKKNRDVVMIYDDLSSHAKIYREVALLNEANPGRDSYPGDMFFAHSSLLERAGKLVTTGKTMTALPIVITPGDDITAFLPTSIMSITDGQLIFDLATFRKNIKPALNAGLSVSRIGGRAQSKSLKVLSGTLFKALGDYRQAAEFAEFGGELAPETKRSLQFGAAIYAAFSQTPNELWSLVEQQLFMQTVVIADGAYTLDINALKKKAREQAPNVKTEADIESLAQELLKQTMVGNQN